jgi:hypothetical protein
VCSVCSRPACMQCPRGLDHSWRGEPSQGCLCRAQLHGAPTLRALQAVLRREGLRGLYGGVTSAALGAGCAHAHPCCPALLLQSMRAHCDRGGRLPDEPALCSRLQHVSRKWEEQCPHQLISGAVDGMRSSCACAAGRCLQGFRQECDGSGCAGVADKCLRGVEV